MVRSPTKPRYDSCASKPWFSSRFQQLKEKLSKNTCFHRFWSEFSFFKDSWRKKLLEAKRYCTWLQTAQAVGSVRRENCLDIWDDKNTYPLFSNFGISTRNLYIYLKVYLAKIKERKFRELWNPRNTTAILNVTYAHILRRPWNRWINP